MGRPRNDLPSVRDAILDILQSSLLPMSIEEICKEAVCGEDEFYRTIDQLDDEGYDVRHVQGQETSYILNRYPDIREGVYKCLGNVELPVLITSDWHIGSFGFSNLAYSQLLNDINTCNIKSIIHCGDLIQGLGVHRTELLDLKIKSTEHQEDLAIRLLKKIPSRVKIHTIIGNHEQKLKGKVQVGHDSIKVIARALPNMTYYGAAARLSLEEEYSIMLMHGEGGTRYTGSKIQILYEQLPERPNILILGHFHTLPVVPRPLHNLAMIAGTLQRENSWMMNKGYIAQVGWHVLSDYSDHKAQLITRFPTVM